MAFEFEKWEGAGNDFVVVDGSRGSGPLNSGPVAGKSRGTSPSLPLGSDPLAGAAPGDSPSSWTDEQVAAVCDRRTGIGSDGLVVVRPIPGGIEVDFRNPDGSRSFCGNGTRCAFSYARAKGWLGEAGPSSGDASRAADPAQAMEGVENGLGDADANEVVIEAVDGRHGARLNAAGLPGISMNVAAWPCDVEPQVQGAEAAAFVHTGSPHHVEFLRDVAHLEKLPLDESARPIRHHARYGEGGTNVNVVSPGPSRAEWVIRTFERGVEAETRSCGTGVVAAALASLARDGESQGTRTLHARGGTLHVEVGKRVWLFGPTRRVFRGTWLGVLVACLATCLRFGGSTGELKAQEGAWHAGMAGDVPTWVSQLGEEAEVSVLTASPGQDVYAAFGHTAIRVQDSDLGIDHVYNYGTFTVNEGFYWRFVKGRLDYKLSVEAYPRFQSVYLRGGRSLLETPLRLTAHEVRQITAFLEVNALPENAIYRYEFFRDNCASKVIDVLQAALGASLEPNCLPNDSTFLEALRPYTAGLPWTAWGMELILGQASHKVMPPCGHAFLPDKLQYQLGFMTLDAEPLAGPTEVVFPVEGRWHAGLAEGDGGRNMPATVMWGWAAWVFVLVWRVHAGSALWMRRLLRISRGITAGAGVLLTALFVAMGTLTDHSDTWWNPDLVWASWGVGTFLVSWRTRKRGPSTAVDPARDWTGRAFWLVWTVAGVASVWVWPWMHGSLPWVAATVWPTAGLNAALGLAFWSAFRASRGR